MTLNKVRLADCCIIKPPKSEAKNLIASDDLVSFVPMKNLGIDTPDLLLDADKKLSDVSGSYTYFKDNDVLLAKITPCFENGKLGVAKGLTNGIGFGSSEYIVFRSKGNLVPEYLYYYLLQQRFRDVGKSVMTGAVGHKRVPKDYIENSEIPLPSFEAQKQIVAKLDRSFAGIDKAKANAEQNLKNAKELFESYLVGVFSRKNSKWDYKKWGDICNFVRGPFGGSLKKSMFKDEGYVVYEQKHAIHDHFNQIRYFIDEGKFNEMKRFEVKPGEIIMSCSGVTLGRVAVIPENIPKGIINQALLKLTPHENISVHFLKHWLRSKIFQDIIFEHAGGAAIPNVPSAKIMKEIIIPVPSINEQEKIVKNIELILIETNKLKANYQEKIKSLDELKQSILQKAFNGELES